MSKNNDNGKIVSCRLGKVGGEAVLEGVMMKGSDESCPKGQGNYAIAVRREDGTVSLKKDVYTSIRSKHKILNFPIIRGVAGFIESMVFSYRALSISAEQYGLDTDEPETKFDKWLSDHLGEHLFGIIMTISMILGFALAFGLFFFLPPKIVIWIQDIFGISFGIFKNLLEGIIKIAIFIGYILLVSLMKDIRRTFEYHGAEHKSIFCYESGEELTVANVKKQGRFHPRCGTSFIFVILIISILVNSLPFVTWDNMALRVLTKLLLLPFIVGIGFEFIMYAGKHDNVFTRICSAPGLWMQRITTREPDDEQIEVAIIALKSALPGVFPDFHHIDPHEETEENVTSEDVSDTDSCNTITDSNNGNDNDNETL